MGWYDAVRYRVAPPMFVMLFTVGVQVLSSIGQDKPVRLFSLEDSFSWYTVSLFLVWGWIWLAVSGRTVLGPPDPRGVSPRYKDNGLLYYGASIFLLLVCEFWRPGFCTRLYLETPQLLGCMNKVALLLCLYMYSVSPPSDRPGPYVFYSGSELHPRFLGVDLKQLTNCRLGLMSWQILILAYFYHGFITKGFSFGAFTNVSLQTAYLLGFFYWESGYFYTLDMTMDRAGYYLCWGCLVWVPCFYTYSTYVTTTWVPTVGWKAAAATMACGLVCLTLKTLVDLERWKFKMTGRSLGGSKAKYMEMTYTDETGTKRQSKFLLSGTWGMARHLNYTFELFTAACWCLPGYGLGHAPFLYVYFLALLLLHRLYRDEEKCSSRYGSQYELYCRKVPYRLLPYIF